MTKLKLLTTCVLAGLLLTGRRTDAAITLVATAQGPSTNGGVSVTSSALNTTGASLLVVINSSYLSTQPQPTISDSKSNTWTIGNPGLTGAGSGSTIAWAVNPTVGSGHTFTSTCATNCYPNVIVLAFAGVTATSPMDLQDGTNGNSSSRSTNSFTTAVAGEVCIVGASGGTTGEPTGPNLAASSSNGASGALTSYASPLVSGQAFGVAGAWQVNTTALTETLTLVDTGGFLQGLNWACFKPSTGGGGPTFTALTLAP